MLLIVVHQNECNIFHMFNKFSSLELFNVRDIVYKLF